MNYSYDYNQLFIYVFIYLFTSSEMTLAHPSTLNTKCGP